MNEAPNPIFIVWDGKPETAEQYLGESTWRHLQDSDAIEVRSTPSDTWQKARVGDLIVENPFGYYDVYVPGEHSEP